MPQQSVANVAGVNWYNADVLLAGLRRVNLFCGGFGSGKTEVAVNFAMHLARAGHRLSIADLDIVNPYFRSREVRSQMRGQGIEVLVPEERLVNADLPIVQPEVSGALEQSRGLVVLDLGGDPVGARVMASLARHIRQPDLTGFLVLNSRRPFTATVESARKMLDEIGLASGVAITDIVVNSHLIEETTADVIEEGIALAEQLSQAAGTRVAFVTVERRLLDRFDAAACRYPVMVLDRLMLKPWEQSNWLGKYRVNI
jgi:hypothetical protein